MGSYSIYIHIPFCSHRCNYCDFNTYAGIQEFIPAYGQALRGEIQRIAQGLNARLPVRTIYFGGGTPSLLPAPVLDPIIQTLEDMFDFDNDIEISLEANPGTLSYTYLQEIKQMGFNRLSLGMQSANLDELRFLERQHTYIDVVEAVKWARQAGFENLSLDLIFGLPDQTPVVWGHSLDLALSLAPEHFSLYALTIEPGTPLGNWFNRGLIPEPDPDLAADMYELASEKLSQGGYLQYEISNWAKSTPTDLQSSTGSPAFASRHNLQYWRNLPYLGLGAGAHGFVRGYRTVNQRSPQKYIQKLKNSMSPENGFPKTVATVDIEPVDRQREISETMLMGLRLTREGISNQRFMARFDTSLGDIFGTEIHDLMAAGLLEWQADHLRLTSKGRFISNQVFRRFV
jgi:oxygen-independent coproporphyrinogen III oxidase